MSELRFKLFPDIFLFPSDAEGCQSQRLLLKVARAPPVTKQEISVCILSEADKEPSSINGISGSLQL